MLVPKECPFCGESPILHQGYGDITYFLCDSCGSISSFRPNLKGEEAIKKWNERYSGENNAT